MKIKNLENLIEQYKALSQEVVDYTKYTYYAATHHSTALEGSTLSEGQVINLLEYGKTVTDKPFEDHLMVFDHDKAIRFVMEEARKKRAITIDFIKQIATKVVNSTGSIVNTISGTYDISKGEFRLSSVSAGTRTFPDFRKVPSLIQMLCDKVNEKLKSVATIEEKCELAFELHFDFISIHPFGDGNGRTARLLMNYIQAYFDLPLSIVFKKDRIRYINALESARKRDDLSPFLKFMYSQYTKLLKMEIKELQAKQ
ncbi:MAG: Fic family protein [Microscillaceae bacterium]|jgi:Fic family protein|nr:Fic family protein [Microscillaceae bacterium]